MAERKKLVIVESPTKAKTIRRFLDSSYMVESCMGHIRDLPESAKDIPAKYKKEPWARLGVNVESRFEPIYLIPKDKAKVAAHLKKKLKEAGELILATDEDREGESISWHLTQILKPKIPVKRIVFHEITKQAITEALKNFRQVNERLVRAQEARRILDRLVGYTISPLLWKKITYGLSAGRVQSTAVKLICEREMERMSFAQAPYWRLEGEFSPAPPGGKKQGGFPAYLKSYKSQKIAEGKDFDRQGRLKDKKLLHLKEKQAQSLIKELKGGPWTVQSLEKKSISRKPPPPFTTSTLQQAANRRLNFSSRQTMAAAQKLYEKGLITYMRTDSTSLSAEALKGIRQAVSRIFGKGELPAAPRVYKTTSKGAQEAHEAIRPAGQSLKPPEAAGLAGAELKLYQLIWQRTLACQMKNCEQEQMSLAISAGEAVFSASGTAIVSPGFYRAYKGLEAGGQPLPPLKRGENLNCLKLEALAKKTQPPARYTEASLIQTLEREGIGRPSTYAPIITAIQNRGYARKKDKKALTPTVTAMAVSKLLSEHLPDYVDLNFTSRMERALDEIAFGKKNTEQYLSRIYKGKNGLKSETDLKEKSIDGKKTRTLSFEPFKDILFHVGRFGAYITMLKGDKELKATLPEDFFLSDSNQSQLEALLHAKKAPDRLIGLDPAAKHKIFLKIGRFGHYLEREGDGKKSSVPKFIPPESLDLDTALKLLELPKTLGQHPKTGSAIKKSIGRFGPYVVHEGDFRSVPKDESFFSIGLKEALEILAKEKKKRRGKWPAGKSAAKKKPAAKKAGGKKAPPPSRTARKKTGGKKN